MTKSSIFAKTPMMFNIVRVGAERALEYRIRLEIDMEMMFV